MTDLSQIPSEDLMRMLASHPDVAGVPPEESQDTKSGSDLLKNAGIDMGQIRRQLGLTARYGLEGVTSLPVMLGDAANAATNYGIKGLNSASGLDIPYLPSVSSLRDKALSSLPEPDTSSERIIGQAARGVASAGTLAGIGGVASEAPGVIGQISKVLATNPGSQMVGGATGGASGQEAVELGVGPVGQLAAGIAGGATGYLTADHIANAVNSKIEQFVAANAGQPTVKGMALGKLAPQTAATAVKTKQSLLDQTDSIVDETLKEMKLDRVPKDFREDLKAQVQAALNRGEKLDPAALLRSKDFQALGLEGTKGQITRDPIQFARERNLRGVEGVGEPLTNRFQYQNNALQSELSNSAEEPYLAGAKIGDRLKSYDDQMRQQVSEAYQTARESAGAKSELNLTGLSQDYADVLDRFGDKVPSAIRSQFERYGLSTTGSPKDTMAGMQRKVMTIDDADKLVKVINSHVGNDVATNRALSELRTAVKNAVESSGDDVFSNARKLASQRFQTQEDVPALADAANGTAPDNFLEKYVLRASTSKAQKLAELLRGTPEEDTVRQQLVEALRRAAFGEDQAGDKPFAPERYAAALRRIGDTKLREFFTEDEVDRFHTIGRVGAYINSQPAASAVNNSNTAGAAMNLARGLLNQVPYVGHRVGNAAEAIARALQRQGFVNDALSPGLVKAKDLTPREAQRLAEILGRQAIVTESQGSVR